MKKLETLCDDCNVYSFADSPDVYYRSCPVTCHCISPLARFHAGEPPKVNVTVDNITIKTVDADAFRKFKQTIAKDGLRDLKRSAPIPSKMHPGEAVIPLSRDVKIPVANEGFVTKALVDTLIQAVTEINARLDKLEAVSHSQITEEDIRKRLKMLEDARLPQAQPMWPSYPQWPSPSYPQWPNPNDIISIC